MWRAGTGHRSVRSTGPRKNAGINARRAEMHKMGSAIVADDPTIDEKEHLRLQRRQDGTKNINDILRGAQEQARVEARKRDVVIPIPDATPGAAAAAASGVPVTKTKEVTKETNNATPAKKAKKEAKSVECIDDSESDKADE